MAQIHCRTSLTGAPIPAEIGSRKAGLCDPPATKAGETPPGLS